MNERRPFYLNLPSGAGTATIILPADATPEDVKALAAFVYTVTSGACQSVRLARGWPT
jgi:hypothetical protein